MPHVPHARVRDRAGRRRTRGLAVHPVRAALGCRTTRGGGGVRRMGNRPRYAVERTGRHLVTWTSTQLRHGALTSRALASSPRQAPPVAVFGRFRRSTRVAGDLLGLLALVLCIPFVILAIGIPIALCARLLLWLGSWL